MKSSDGDLVFQHYLIIYLDLVGQRDALRKLRNIPLKESEKTEFVNLVRDSVGAVLKIRKAFKSFFDGFLNHIRDSTLVSPEYQEEFIKARKSNFSFYGFSDAIVIAVPLMVENENCTAINGIFASLAATSAVTLLSLSMKIAVRAGIDVGICTELENREIYGAALASAVRIECQFAEYPRLVVGNEMIQYLIWVENQESKTKMGQIASKMATKCRMLLIQDNDGRVMLDYLGKDINEIFECKIKRETVQKAWDYVREQHLMFINEGNQKLAPRYYRMERYLKSRLYLWDISKGN